MDRKSLSLYAIAVAGLSVLLLVSCLALGRDPGSLFGSLTSSVSSPLSPRHHIDNGFMIMPNGEPVRWHQSDLPIVVFVHSDAALWVYHAMKAAAIWNHALGMEIFQVSPELHDDADIFVNSSPGIVPILAYEPDELEHNPYTFWHSEAATGYLTAAPIYMPNTLYLAVHPDSYLLLVHEFGHALGLAHDSQAEENGTHPWSIMEPKLRMPVEGEPPPITQHDIALLKEWYGAKPIPRVGTATTTETPAIPTSSVSTSTTYAF